MTPADWLDIVFALGVLMLVLALLFAVVAHAFGQATGQGRPDPDDLRDDDLDGVA